MQESKLPLSATVSVPPAGAFLSRTYNNSTLNRSLKTIAGNFFALLALIKLPPVLFSARSHSLLLSHNRMRFISARSGSAAIFLCIVTIAWIPIDVVLFNADWQVLIPLIMGRVAAGILFLAIASLRFEGAAPYQGVGAIGLMMGVGICFLSCTHFVIQVADNSHLAELAHAQYLLMPIALAAGISVFPLTFIEAALLLAGPVIVLAVETLYHDGGLVGSTASVAAFMMWLIAITTVVCSLTQLRLLIGLHEQSIKDPLTRALSRRAGMELLNILFAKSQRSNGPFSLVLLDLDHFKQVNDNYGHGEGDRVLRKIAQYFNGVLKCEDVLIRWGGEEFVLVLPGASAESAAQFVIDLCQSCPVTRPDGTMLTLSGGLAERQSDKIQNWQRLVEIADDRMYEAKEGGRDRLNTKAESYRLTTGRRPVAKSASLIPSLPAAAIGAGGEVRPALAPAG